MKPNKCNHYWCYEQAIWGTGRSDESVSVGRYCFKCGKTQTATASKWRPLPKSYVDMREALHNSVVKDREALSESISNY